MEKLIAAQRELHGRIARTSENLRKVGVENWSASFLQTALQTLDSKWNKFEDFHERLQIEFGDELQGHQYTTSDFVSLVETAYIQQRAYLLNTEQSLAAPVDADGSKTTRSDSAASRNGLPRIQLPEFSGNFEHWPSFRDLFSSIIAAQNSLSRVEKLHYLKTSVKGDAELLIQNLPVTEDNFERAWTTLSSHYENKRLLLRSHLSAFTAIPRMKSDSIADLRRIFHGVITAVGSLEGIGRPISDGMDLFVHLVVELFDGRTRREWESSLGKTSVPPTYSDLHEFLQTQLMTQEAFPAVSRDSSGKSAVKASRSTRINHAKSQGSESQRNCPLCKKEHFIAFCEQYKRKTAQERRNTIATHQRCWNCLGRHTVKECSSSKTCLKCASQHHTSLHEAFAAAALPAPEPSTSAAVHIARRPPVAGRSVLLATARVLVTDYVGVRHAVRALIDPGAETSLVTESLAQRLRLPRAQASDAILSIGGVWSGSARGQVSVKVSARAGPFALTVSALVLPHRSLYDVPVSEGASSWPHIKDLELADPHFLSQDPVELLLGVYDYADIALPEIRRGAPSEPIAQRTQLGWILMGAKGAGRAASSVLMLRCSAVDELSAAVRRFWECEEPPKAATPLSPEEQQCEDHFVRTHERLADGRYQVRLPIRTELPDLTTTRRAATRMLATVSRRFERDADFRDKYRTFMADYADLGHMVIAPKLRLDGDARVCYLPHHGVMKGTGVEAKIRVVFNGSSRVASGASLNNALHTGPNLLPHLADVLSRWRRHRYAFVADVQKMYRQILVNPADRDLQRILWGDDTQTEYQLTTVTYGLGCAPYLAIRVLRQLAEDEKTRFPLGAAVLLRDVYVDDVLSGASDLASSQQLRIQVTALCTAGGFPLRKWASNAEEVLAGVPSEHRLQSASTTLLPSDDHAVLGLRWNPRTDDFSPIVKQSVRTPLTKRAILSQTAQLFDPLGWLAPVVVRAKLLIQTTWLQQLDWDAPLATEEATTWTRVEEELPLLESIRVPRWFGYDDCSSAVEIHGFSDASERAFAAVVYLKTTLNHQTNISIVMAKTKVAPLKRISLPRLELLAAELLSKLTRHVVSQLDLVDSDVHLWTDSTVTLAWIRGHPAKWTTFVANRVTKIQRDSEGARWHHVPGRDNPADCASRGILPRELLEHPLWWQGPDFLRHDAASWPKDPGALDGTLTPEQRPPRCLVTEVVRELPELLRFSSLSRLIRVTAWILRWRHHCVGDRRSRLQTTELNAALSLWIRVVQSTFFQQELKDARAGLAVPKQSTLHRLTPMLDKDGILRVGSRLKHAPYHYDQRYPVILPPDSHLTLLIIRASHRRTLHGGTQATLANIRQKYWVPRGRQLVRRHIHRCLPCIRWRAASPQPLMGVLPKERVTPSRPFLHTGVDFAGPIWLRTSKGRGNKAYKAFLAVFICFSSRAVHLEVASDYSTDAFLAAFRRFVSRRGVCEAVYSDRGTNFVGADSQLRALFSAAGREMNHIIDRLTEDGIRWRFNPPAAPHFGGLWEAAVKALKHHLRRVIGETRLTFEEMTTFLAEAEACLNSRPLQALSDDADDPEALTPGHFLIGRPLNAIPEPSLLDVPSNRLSRWRLLQQMRDHFWQRWSREYLQGLTPRQKWWTTAQNLREGQLCFLRNEATYPGRWPLARVVRLHPGEDGQVRVVDVRTRGGELTRPVVKIVPFPTTNTAETELSTQS